MFGLKIITNVYRKIIIGRLFIGFDPDPTFIKDRTEIYIMQNTMGGGGGRKRGR